MQPLLFCLLVDRDLCGTDEMNIDYEMSFILLRALHSIHVCIHSNGKGFNHQTKHLLKQLLAAAVFRPGCFVFL